MAEIIRPKFGGDGGGDGPEDPMLDGRVTRREGDARDVKAALAEIRADVKHLPKATDLAALRAEFSGLKPDLAGMKGRLSQAPTLLQLVTVVNTTWSAGAAMVFTLLRFARPN